MPDLASLELRVRLAPWWEPVFTALVFLAAHGIVSQATALRWGHWLLDRALSVYAEEE